MLRGVLPCEPLWAGLHSTSNIARQLFLGSTQFSFPSTLSVSVDCWGPRCWTLRTGDDGLSDKPVFGSMLGCLVFSNVHLVRDEKGTAWCIYAGLHGLRSRRGRGGFAGRGKASHRRVVIGGGKWDRDVFGWIGHYFTRFHIGN